MTKVGKHPGPGRPRKPPTKNVGLRLTERQHSTYIAKGGAAWLKKIIDRASVIPGPGMPLVLRADAQRLLERVLPILDAAAGNSGVGQAAGQLARELRHELYGNNATQTATSD